MVYFDGGDEYQALASYLSTCGTQHLKSPPHTQLVGSIERKYRYIVEIGLILLHQASMPSKFWTTVFQTTFYLINRMPTPVLQYQSLFDMLFHKPPNIRNLRLLGCLCYPWLPPYASHKLTSRSNPCILYNVTLFLLSLSFLFKAIPILPCRPPH